MPKKQDSKLDHKDRQAKIDQLEHALKRALADFENYRKRMEIDQAHMSSMSKIGILENLLPIIDNFSRAVNHLPEAIANDSWVTGVLAINKQFEEFLIQQGLEKISANPGDQFNPNIHEAISHESHETIKVDNIIECVTPGYSVNGQILRPSRVRVSAGGVKNS